MANKNKSAGYDEENTEGATVDYPMQPTHKLSIITKDRTKKGVVGAAWMQSDGSFFITLNAGVYLSWQDDITIRLFPIGKRTND
jgi:hypothetical protein